MAFTLSLRTARVAYVFSLIVLTACSSGGGGASAPTAPPAGLTYETNPAVYVVGTAATPNAPVSTGGVPSSYSVEPALPPGLSVNTLTGVIGGTPTATAASASYTVTARNALGSTTAILTVSVKATLPPSSLVYATNPAVYNVGTAIAPNVASFVAGPVGLGFSVAPPLPSGLVLNTQTGTISGTPIAVTATGTYSVTVSNVEGARTVTLALTVNDLPPSNLTYAVNPAAYTAGVAVTPNGPTSQGGAVTFYSVAPPLPSGLALNQMTGVISGTPMALADATFVVSATNSGGSTSANVRIKVNPPPPPVVTTHPATQFAPVGRTASFSVVASGKGELSYQWRKNGTAISGAASVTYTTPPVVAADNNATFTVIVSDAFGGTVTSAGATLRAEGFAPTGSLVAARTDHTATLLANGKVLVAGGGKYGVTILSSAELYDPSSGIFASTGSMNSVRFYHSATRLQNGKVLVAGGFPTTLWNTAAATTSADLYDPGTGAFSATGALTTGRGHHSATLLQNGKVLITGGLSGGTVLSSAELYDPTGSFTTTGSMTTSRAYHTATLMQDGRVLITGGFGNGFGSIPTAEVYDPSTGQFTATGSMPTSAYGQLPIPLADGKVLVVGGFNASTYFPSSALYDPGAGTFSGTGPMNSARAAGTLTLLPSGKALAAGGYPGGGNTYLATSEVYDPATGAFGTSGRMGVPRFGHTATLLQNGNVLVIGGGTDGTADPLGSAEIWSTVP